PTSTKRPSEPSRSFRAEHLSAFGAPAARRSAPRRLGVSVILPPGVEDGPLDPVADRGRLGGGSRPVGLFDLFEDLLHRRRADVNGKVLDGSESGTDVIHETADPGLTSPEVHAFELSDG